MWGTAGDLNVLNVIGMEKKHADHPLSAHLCLFILDTFNTSSISALSELLCSMALTMVTNIFTFCLYDRFFAYSLSVC